MTTTTHPVRVTDWSIGSIALQGQTVGSSAIPHFGLYQAPAGLLGSDVLSRFGALRIDYQQQKLVLPGPKARSLLGSTSFGGLRDAHPSRSAGRVSGGDRTPAGCGYIAHQVIAVTPVQFSSPVIFTFVVDTGSSGSAISTEAASSLKLPRGRKRQEITGATCQTSVALVRSGKWSMSGTPLLSETLTSAKLPSSGIYGLIGSNQLSRFGSIVIDYAGGDFLSNNACVRSVPATLSQPLHAAYMALPPTAEAATAERVQGIGLGLGLVGAAMREFHQRSHLRLG